MYDHPSPYIVTGEELNSAHILVDAIRTDPGGFCVSDYSLFTTMFGHHEPGSQEARVHFLEKLKEELGELDQELDKSPIERERTIEEYGDASFCVFALGSAFNLDATIFVKDLLTRQAKRKIQCRSDQMGPPFVESVISSGVVRQYQATRYGYVFLGQPYIYPLRPSEAELRLYQRTYQIETLAMVMNRPLNIRSQMLAGYTLADIWLGETKRTSEALHDDRVMVLGMLNNMTKILARVEESSQK